METVTCDGYLVIEVDPTELLPGDVVMALSDHDLAGCHCDVRVTVKRWRKESA